MERDDYGTTFAYEQFYARYVLPYGMWSVGAGTAVTESSGSFGSQEESATGRPEVHMR